MPRPLVIQTEDLDPVPAAWLAERCDLIVCPHSDGDRLRTLLPRADGLVVRTYTKVNTELLALAPRLRVVGRAGVALENIDVPACLARGVKVVHTPGANTRAVVEFAAAVLLDAVRPRLYLDRAVEPDRWHQLRRELVGERQLCEMTLGLYGFGRIGSAMARVGAAKDMRVLYNDLIDIPADRRAGAEPVSPERLLAESDVLSVHVDYRPANRHLLNAAAFARLKPNTIFINTSRGFVVDPTALAAHLRANPTAVALVDVHDPTEPIDAAYPLWGLPNARITPHLASGTETAKRNMSWVVKDVWRVLTGEPPEWPAKTPGG